MNKLYTAALFSLMAISSFSQNIEIHKNGVLVVSPTLTIDSASTVEYADSYYYLVNTTGAALDVTWSRTRLAHASSIVEDQICDMILCFTADDQTIYNRPLTFSIPAGDSSVFQPKVWPGDVAACAIYTYKIYSGLGNLEDSIQIKFRFDGQDCFLSNEEEKSITFSAYPNPATNNLNVQLQTNGNNVQLVLYNVIGEKVLVRTLNDGLNSIDIETLNNGVYFYSVLKNNDVIETKKLVIRH